MNTTLRTPSAMRETRTQTQKPNKRFETADSWHKLEASKQHSPKPNGTEIFGSCIVASCIASLGVFVGMVIGVVCMLEW